MSHIEDDYVPELPSDSMRITTDDIQQMVTEEMRKNPSQFASYWEEDEEDINVATEEEIKTDPVKRVLWAAETGNIEVLREMLSLFGDLVDATDDDGYTPLHRAAYEGHCEAIELLLGAGARIDARTNDGWTALHSASNWGQADVAAILLCHGADINSQTNGLQTSLHLAAANAGDAKIFQLLLMNELLDPEIRNSVGETANQVAERSSRFHKLFQILDRSVNSFTPAS